MKDENAEHLLNQFDHLFSTFIIRNGQHAKHQFSIGNGWYAILFDLCAALDRIIDAADDKGRKVTVDTLQIKEKFGGLRFYKQVTVENEALGSKWFRKTESWIGTVMCRNGFAKTHWAIHRWRRKHIYETLYEKVATAVGYAESQSYIICEVCGEEGNRCSPNGWLLTLCEKHEKESKKEND
jgi:hypothetical protein